MVYGNSKYFFCVCVEIVISDEFRNQMGQSAVDAAKAVGYVGAGMIIFIKRKKHSFMIFVW